MGTVKPGELHMHRCGWAPLEGSETGPHGKGCGYVFMHNAPSTAIPDADYNHMHCCPLCKAGPWTMAWSQNSENYWNSLSPEEQEEFQEQAAIRDTIDNLISYLFRRP